MADSINREASVFQLAAPLFSRPKFCQFCADKNIEIDYKAVDIAAPVCHRRRQNSPTPSNGHLRPPPARACSRHQARPPLALLPFVANPGRTLNNTICFDGHRVLCAMPYI